MKRVISLPAPSWKPPTQRHHLLHCPHLASLSNYNEKVKSKMATWLSHWLFYLNQSVIKSLFLSECGRRAPWEGCGAAQGSSGNGEVGSTIHPQSPGGNGVPLRENEVGKASATEQLPQVGLCQGRDAAQFLFHCSSCILTTAPSRSLSKQCTVGFFNSHIC